MTQDENSVILSRAELEDLRWQRKIGAPIRKGWQIDRREFKHGFGNDFSCTPHLLTDAELAIINSDKPFVHPGDNPKPVPFTGDQFSFEIHPQAQPLVVHCGPSLRDQFAMTALTGLLAGVAQQESVSNQDVGSFNIAMGNETFVAKTAYSLADAMLEARKPKGEK